MKKILLIFIVSLVFYSCGESIKKTENEIDGSYSFEFPRGDYEILEINKDSSFVQKFYIDKKAFKNNISPFYTSSGNWSFNNKNELNFDNWLKYCSRRNPDSILLKPKQVNLLNVYWYRATKKHNGYLSIYGETGYYFKKLNKK